MKKKILVLVAVASIGLVVSLYACEGKDKCKRKGSEKHFKKLDKNNDGKISKSEWMAKFKMIDANGNGSISKNEMKKHHEMMRRKHKKNHKK